MGFSLVVMPIVAKYAVILQKIWLIWVGMVGVEWNQQFAVILWEIHGLLLSILVERQIGAVVFWKRAVSLTVNTSL